MATVAMWRGGRQGDRLFYSGCSASVGVVILIGFARSWFLAPWFDTPPGTPEITPLLVAHGIVLSTWVAITVTQPLLIAGRNVALHRRLGWTGSAVAILAVVLANVASVAAMHVGFIGLGDPAAFYAIPFFDIQTFAILVALAVWFRKRAELHKRLMLLSSTQLMEAAFARVPLAIIQDHAPWGSFVAGDWIIVAGIAYDLWSRGRVHPVWIWGGSFVAVSEIVRLLIWHSEPWLAFAHAMASVWR
jgi:hypothetical protein